MLKLTIIREIEIVSIEFAKIYNYGNSVREDKN